MRKNSNLEYLLIGSFVFAAYSQVMLGCTNRVEHEEPQMETVDKDVLPWRRFRVPVDVVIHPSTNEFGSRIGAAILQGDPVDEVAAEMPVLEGSMQLWSPDGTRLVLQQLSFSVADTVVDGVGPIHKEMVISNVKVRLARVVTQRLDSPGGTVRFEVDLEVSWSVVLGGKTVVLSPFMVEDLPLDLAIEQGEDDISLYATAFREGIFWDWASWVQMKDLELDVLATGDSSQSLIR